MLPLPSLQIGSYRVQYPIIQGGMGIRVSGARLAAAVANAGGIGIISAVALGYNSPYFRTDSKGRRCYSLSEANRLALIDELQAARHLSPQGVIGINSMVAAQDHAMLVRTAAAHGADLIISGAGLPLNLPEYTQDYPHVALIPVVSSPRAAHLICRRWWSRYQRLPDAIVVETPNRAGGHLGTQESDLGSPLLDLEQLIPAVVSTLQQQFDPDIPVIAAGGIWDRQDIDGMLALGARGVQIATRLITTHECDADERYKQFHLQASPQDVVILPSPVGLPGRALRNAFAEKVLAGGEQLKQLDKSCVGSCLNRCRCRDHRELYCILKALDRAVRGDVENGLIFAGSNGGRAVEMVTVADLFKELVGESVDAAALKSSREAPFKSQ
jgi:nitronate monooxygenase